MGSNLLYDLYAFRLRQELKKASIPRHIAVILDGNRRWAKSMGSSPADGHRAGADRISEFLDWSESLGVEVVTLWMLSTDNLSRDAGEIHELLSIIASAVEALAKQQRWHMTIAGDLSLFPEAFKERLEKAAATTENIPGMQVNVAVGYGGRHELVGAVRELLLEAEASGTSPGELAQSLTDADITNHLYTRGQPDPDLVIRTSGEQRLSGFMMWQSAHAEFYFCETYWPDFRKVDFLRALRSYSQRERRHGR